MGLGWIFPFLLAPSSQLGCRKPQAELADTSARGTQVAVERVDREKDARAVAVARDGKVIAAGHRRGRVELLDAASGEHLRDLEPVLSNVPWALEFSPDGERLAGLGHDGKLVVWSLTRALASPPLAALPSCEDRAKEYPFGASMAWSPSADRLVVGDWDGNTSLWTATGELVQRWVVSDPPGDPQLAWSPDGELLLTADGALIRARDAETGEVVSKAARPGEIDCGDEIVALAIHPQGRLVATGHADDCLRLWNPETGKLEYERRYPDSFFPERENELAAIAFSPDGERLAFSTREGTYVRVIDVQTRERLWTSDYHGAHFFEVMQLCWSPDGSRLWYSFACGGGGLFCVEPEGEAAPVVVGSSNVPRFAGAIGVIRPRDAGSGIGAVGFDGERLW